jgi:hypothetical protein
VTVPVWKIEDGGWRGAILLTLCFVIHNSSFMLAANSQTYSIDRSTINGGGGTSTGGVYAVCGTIGQPDASNAMTNASYSVTGGFWVLPQAVQVENAPTLLIANAGTGLAQISWSPASTNWVLQERVSLTAGSWTNSPSSMTNPVVVPATLPKKFYRLFKP